MDDLGTEDDLHVTGALLVTQSDWAIKPYPGLMGAVKVRDTVKIVVDVRLPLD
jgi:hypothetical protein